MNEQEFEQAIMRDLEALATLPERISLQIRPIDAFFLLSHLQLALRHPENTGETAKRVEQLARKLQQLVSRTPALAEACERGWHDDHSAPLVTVPESWVRALLKDVIDTITNQLTFAGADGVFLIRDASHVQLGLEWFGSKGSEHMRDFEVQPPHPLIVVAVFAESDGGPSGIETR